MAFRVYMLQCSDGRYYTGHTDDLDRRIAQRHAGGHCDYSSRRRPVSLVWSQTSCLVALEAERAASLETAGGEAGKLLGPA